MSVREDIYCVICNKKKNRMKDVDCGAIKNKFETKPAEMPSNPHKHTHVGRMMRGSPL